MKNGIIILSKSVFEALKPILYTLLLLLRIPILVLTVFIFFSSILGLLFFIIGNVENYSLKTPTIIFLISCFAISTLIQAYYDDLLLTLAD